MAHIHDVIDTDVHYKIDGVSRVITNIDETKRELVQYDHKSERLTFEIPRYVDGHDFLNVNSVQVHYENVDTFEKNRSADIYNVDDLHVSSDDENIVVLSWLVENTATKYVGTLSFSIRFSCITNGVVDYAWGTKKFKDISILEGVYISSEIEEQYSDAIAGLTAKIKDLEAKDEDIIKEVTDKDIHFSEIKSTGRFQGNAQYTVEKELIFELDKKPADVQFVPSILVWAGINVKSVTIEGTMVTVSLDLNVIYTSAYCEVGGFLIYRFASNDNTDNTEM